MLPASLCHLWMQVALLILEVLNMEELLCNDALWNESLVKLYKRGVYTNLNFPSERMKVIKQLLDGTYKFNPPTLHTIPKDDGGTRELLVLSDRDRIVMDVLYTIYYKEYSKLIDPSCTSYQTGKAVATTVRDVQKHYKPGVKLDLSKYFDTVSQETINVTLSKMFPESGPTKCLLKFYNTPVIIYKGKETKRYKSLCQGCSFSALLANIVLAPIDVKMSAMCDYYTRYSDDILIMDDHIEDKLQSLSTMLNEYCLKLNIAKTKWFTDSVDYLGVTITSGSLSIGKKGWKHLKQVVRHVIHVLPVTGTKEKYIHRAYKRLLRVLHTATTHEYSALTYWKNISSTDEDFVKLDLYCRDTVRAHYTRTYNVTHNLHVLPNELFDKAGWINFKTFYHMPTHIMSAYIRSLIKLNKLFTEYEEVPVCEYVTNCMSLWKLAKYYKNSFLNAQPLPDECTTFLMEDVIKAHSELVRYIKSHKPEFGDNYYLEIADNLYVFKDWYERK